MNEYEYEVQIIDAAGATVGIKKETVPAKVVELVRADAIDEFAEMLIAEGQKRKYLRHIWIEQTCKKIVEQLKEQK